MFDNEPESITFWKAVAERIQADLWLSLGIYATHLKVSIEGEQTPPYAMVEAWMPEIEKTLQFFVSEEAVDDISKLEEALDQIVGKVRSAAEELKRHATHH